MTQKEFSNTSFKKGMKVLYNGIAREVICVDFASIEIALDNGSSYDWVSALDCEIISEN